MSRVLRLLLLASAAPLPSSIPPVDFRFLVFVVFVARTVLLVIFFPAPHTRGNKNRALELEAGQTVAEMVVVVDKLRAATRLGRFVASCHVLRCFRFRVYRDGVHLI